MEIPHSSRIIIVLCTVLVFLCLNTEGCELDQTQYGCRIDNGQCSCAYGCRAEFRYTTRKECLDALKGRSGNMCFSEPCMNRGGCTQISQMPGYKCRCEGTGYYGNRCQSKCPSASDKIVPYPTECIVI